MCAGPSEDIGDVGALLDHIPGLIAAVAGTGAALRAVRVTGVLADTNRDALSSEVVDDAALLVPPGDADALARAIQRVLDEPGLATRLRAAGPMRAAEFTWAACVDQHVAAYQRAAFAGARA